MSLLTSFRSLRPLTKLAAGWLAAIAHTKPTGRGALLLAVAWLTATPMAATAADGRPSGLLTDLIAHTDVVLHGGYPTTLPLEAAVSRGSRGAGADDFQTAAIATGTPTFSWVVPDEGVGTRQTAYRLILTDSPRAAAEGRGTLWDSGWRPSAQSTAIRYAGATLRPDAVYYWRVKVRTSTGGESEWSAVKAFATAATLDEEAFSTGPIWLSDEVLTAAQATATDSLSRLFDFGTDCFGRLSLTARGRGGDTLTLVVGERLADGHVDPRPGGTIRAATISLPLVTGVHTYAIDFVPDSRNTRAPAVRLPDYVGVVMPFRYVEIAGRCAVSTLTRTVARGTERLAEARFACSDTALTEVVGLCDQTIDATSFAGVYVDGDRERIPYEADALINQLSHYAVSRDYALARHTLLYLLDHPTWPTEWIMQGIMIAWNDYLYTGDCRLLRVCYERLKPRTLLALTDGDGLVSTRTGRQDAAFKASISYAGDKIDDIVDWPRVGFGVNQETGGESDGFVFEDYNAVVNAYHCEVLREMAAIADVLGKKDDAREYQQLYEVRKALFNRVFFDAKEGRYADGARTRHASLHANIFPLAFDLVPVKEKARVQQFVESRGMACSVYGAQFLLDALYNAGNADYALRLMTDTVSDRSWMTMLRAGATMTWEAWDLKYKSNLDWNHAWGTAPGNVVRRKLMGLEPLTPGWESARLRPCLGSLQWAKGTVPTVKGDIIFDAQQTDGTVSLRITLPANLPAVLELPLAVGRSIQIDGKATRRASTLNGYAHWNLPPGTHEIVYKK